jgi:hypothetical protein
LARHSRRARCSNFIDGCGVDAEKLAELFELTLGGWSEEKDARLALFLVSGWA